MEKADTLGPEARASFFRALLMEGVKALTARVRELEAELARARLGDIASLDIDTVRGWSFDRPYSDTDSDTDTAIEADARRGVFWDALVTRYGWDAVFDLVYYGLILGSENRLRLIGPDEQYDEAKDRLSRLLDIVVYGWNDDDDLKDEIDTNRREILVGPLGYYDDDGEPIPEEDEDEDEDDETTEAEAVEDTADPPAPPADPPAPTPPPPAPPARPQLNKRPAPARDDAEASEPGPADTVETTDTKPGTALVPVQAVQLDADGRLPLPESLPVPVSVQREMARREGVARDIARRGLIVPPPARPQLNRRPARDDADA